jgi:hypothetical protein
VCGAQDHVWPANIAEDLTLFTTHPAGNGNGRYGASPGYWVGNGRRPMSIQNENVNVTIYKIPEKKCFGESDIAAMTHAYMPKDFYDKFEICGNTVFACKNGVYVALISNGKLEFRPFDRNSANGVLKGRKFPNGNELDSEFDLCRYGDGYHIYITELSDSDKETYDEFKQRIKSNAVYFGDDGKVEYSTASGNISVSYGIGYSVNGILAKTEFMRYDSKFCKAARKDETITVIGDKCRLVLNFGKAERHFVPEQ